MAIKEEKQLTIERAKADWPLEDDEETYIKKMAEKYGPDGVPPDEGEEKEVENP